MTVYLDVVFFLNFLYQLGILLILKGMFRLRASMGRILAGATLGSVVYCGILILGFPVRETLFRLAAGAFIGILSLSAAFLKKDGKGFGVLILAEWFLAFCLAGILEAFLQDGGEKTGILAGCAAIVFMSLFCIKIRRLWLERTEREGSIFKLRLIHRGRSVCAAGLLDTGNGLTDPISGEPVMIIQKNIWKVLLDEAVSGQKGYRLIPYQSIGTGKGLLEAFRLERLEIKDERGGRERGTIVRTQVICAVYGENFGDGTAYEVLLHPLLL